MQGFFDRVGLIISHLKEYIENRVSLAKLNLADVVSKMLAGFIAIAVVLVLLVFALLFSGVALAFVFGRLTGELYLGFLIVAGIYMLLAISVWIGRNKLLRFPIMNAILSQLLNDENKRHE